MQQFDRQLNATMISSDQEVQSIKAGLDIDWSDPKQKVTAIQIVEQQVSSLHRWVERHLDEELSAPLTPYIRAITRGGGRLT